MFKKHWAKNPTDAPSKFGNIDFLLTDFTPENNPYRIVKASEHLPEWFKKMPSKAYIKPEDKLKDFTIKRCIPVLDALSTGYYVVTAKDYTFTFNEETGLVDITGAFNNPPEISSHPLTQIATMPLSSEYAQLPYKWNNGYTIKTPKGYSCLITHPFNYPSLPFYTLTGVVDTDRYMQPVLFPMLVKTNFTGLVPAGTPIAQVVPFKRDDWKSSIIDKPGAIVKASREKLAALYEAERRDKDGNALGGAYKRWYREKKTYL